MVAAYWEPSSRTVYSSTVPYGGRKIVMQRTAARDAPVWFSKVRNLTPSHTNWHAEDGAYYTYEVTTKQKPTGNRYNPGSMVAAQGRRFAGDKEGPHPLCGAEPRRNPSCEEVAAALGIVQGNTAQPQPPMPPPNQDDEFDDGTTDADLVAAEGQTCPAPGQGPNNVSPKQKRRLIHGRGLERRVSGSTCISVNVQSSVPAQKLDSPLPAFDIASASPSSRLSPSTTPPITTPPTTAPPSGQPSAVNSSAQGNVMCATEDTCNEGSVRSGESCNRNDVFCRATNYVAVITQEGSGNGQIIAHLELELAYDAKSNPFDQDICDLVILAVDAGLQLLGPELEPADIAAAGEAGAACREGQVLAENVQSIVAVATATGSAD